MHQRGKTALIFSYAGGNLKSSCSGVLTSCRYAMRLSLKEIFQNETVLLRITFNPTSAVGSQLNRPVFAKIVRRVRHRQRGDRTTGSESKSAERKADPLSGQRD